MAKVKLVLQSWEEVDQALREIGDLDREIKSVEAEKKKKINVIKDEAKVKAAPYEERIKILGKYVEAFVKANKSEFKIERTRKMMFGEVGYALNPPSITIHNIDTCLAGLKRLGLKHCIITEEKPDKSAMMSLADEVLIELGARRTQTEKIVLKAYEEKVNEE